MTVPEKQWLQQTPANVNLPWGWVFPHIKSFSKCIQQDLTTMCFQGNITPLEWCFHLLLPRRVVCTQLLMEKKKSLMTNMMQSASNSSATVLIVYGTDSVICIDVLPLCPSFTCFLSCGLRTFNTTDIIFLPRCWGKKSRHAF